jgi:hypothetical protein
MGVKGFLLKVVATGDLATTFRKTLDEVNVSTQEFVILFLSIGRFGNVYNTERMQKVVVPKKTA